LIHEGRQETGIHGTFAANGEMTMASIVYGLSQDNNRNFGVGELREVSQRDRYIPKFEIMDK
jgi:hypothetical protein